MKISRTLYLAIFAFYSHMMKISEQMPRQRTSHEWLVVKSKYLLSHDSLPRGVRLKRQIVAVTTKAPTMNLLTTFRMNQTPTKMPTLKQPAISIRTIASSSQAFKPTQPVTKTKPAAAQQQGNTPAPVRDPHADVPEPFDVMPVQTVPAQRFLATPVPTPMSTSKVKQEAGNKTHNLLPNLPVFNVSLPSQGVLPVEPVKDAPLQNKVAGEMSPVEPLPVMTRPTVTVLQHVIGPRPTQATLQSVVVPKRKEVTPPAPLAPLDVIPPHTVPTQMKLLKQLKPIPPHEPHIVHHIPIIPKECHCDPCTNSCDCNTNCSGR